MQLTSMILLLSAAMSASAHPAAIEELAVRDAAEPSASTTPKGADFACDHSGSILGQQLAEMAKLKAQNISIPPYLAGYYTAINSGRQAIGCPGSLPVRRRQFTPTQEPCDVTNEQHERMMVLIDRFEKENIGVAPFIAGFLSATLDEHHALGCPPFTGEAADAPVPDVAASENVTDSSTG